jgi:mycofactocin glycosyltransferase
VSFVVPVMNHTGRLHSCLESITRNDYPRELIEIIVVDDGTRDDTARVAREHGAIVLTSRGRAAELRNRGARAALGSILAFVDPGRDIDRRWIQRVVKELGERHLAAAGAPHLAMLRSHFDDRGGFDAALDAEDPALCA